MIGFDEASSESGLKPEVKFISESEGDETSFPAVVTRNNTDSDGGLEWKAVLDVNPSTHTELADLESDLGFLITVRDPSGNERELGFDAAGISSDTSQPTEAPAKMARVDLKAPEVETFAFTSSNAGLNNDDFVVMLPNSNREDGEALCKNLLADISRSRHAHQNVFLIKLATYRPEDDSYSLLKRAASQFEETK